MSTFGQIGAMLSRSGGKDRDIEDMPERINNMEGSQTGLRRDTKQKCAMYCRR